MRILREALVIAVFGLIGPAVGAQDAREIVERGMKARCDKTDLLEKQKCSIIAMKGKMPLNFGDASVEGEIKTEWPRSFRWDSDAILPDAKDKTRVSFAIQAGKGWKKLGPAPLEELNLVDLDTAQAEMYARWVATLCPLKEKAYAFSLLKDNTVGGEEVAVVKAEMRSQPDMILSFAKKSGNLLRIAYRANDLGALVRKEHYFSEYKEFDGLRLPTKWTDYVQRDNRPPIKSGEWLITSYKFPEKFDKNPFEKPQGK